MIYWYTFLSYLLLSVYTIHAHVHATREQKVLEIIHEVADVHVNAASRAIQRSLAETMDEVTFALDKASLPRPAALGILRNNAGYCRYVDRVRTRVQGPWNGNVTRIFKNHNILHLFFKRDPK